MNPQIGVSGTSNTTNKTNPPPPGPCSLCQIDGINEMDDGTIVTQFSVQFHYVDNTSSSASASGSWERGGGTSVFSENKCVTWFQIYFATRRPDNTEEEDDCSSDHASGGQCWIRAAYALGPASQVLDWQRGNAYKNHVVEIRRKT